MPQEQVHASRTHEQHQADQHTEMDALADQAVTDASERTPEAEATLDHTDELLDEIDAILTVEENFAKNYVQKGGQ